MTRVATKRAERTRGFSVTEKHIVIAIRQLLEHHQWVYIPTPAEAWLPSGRRVVRKGHSDAAFVRSWNKLAYTGTADFFFAEFKRPNAKTDEQHAADQARWQMEMQARGLLAYRCPDGCGDPIEHFRAWYKDNFGEEL